MPPPSDRLPSLEDIWPWVDRRLISVERRHRARISVRRIVGMSCPTDDWGPDWRPRPCGKRIYYDDGKLRPLLYGFKDQQGRRHAPLTQHLLLDPWYTRAIELNKIDGVYFVSNCLHRVSAAHLLNRQSLVAWVTPLHLRKNAPTALCLWLSELGRRTLR